MAIDVKMYTFEGIKACMFIMTFETLKDILFKEGKKSHLVSEF